MKPVIACMSYGELTSLIEKNKHKFSNSADIKIIDKLIEDAIKIAGKMEKNSEADVFVCSGNFSSLSCPLSNPVVEIKVTGYDMLLALKKAKEYSNKISIVTHKNNKIQYLHEIQDILTVSVKQLSYNNPFEAEKILNKLFKEGVDNIIGPGLVFELANKLGMHATLIYSEDGVNKALATAISIALSKKKESERAERFRIIMDFAHEGIVATDKNGIVTVINPQAEKITKVSRKAAIGCPIEKVLPNDGIAKVLQSGKPEINQIHAIREVKVVTNMVPLIVNNEVAGAVATFKDVSAIQEAEEKIRKKTYEKGLVAKFYLNDILGNSEQISEAKRKALLYAQSESTVLIIGESGTGKELFAQGIHNASIRSKRPFVAINCQALPDNLLESELFGYEEGAFTGAKKGGKPGIFEIAHGGTIFLDEIGEISPKLQSRLLRVLEEYEVMRIGSSRIRHVNIRVIAATNINLWERVNQGKFREDLYYRLNVLELNVPPLRSRKKDIPLLVTKFLSELRSDLKESEIAKIAKHPLFIKYGWPGNIRELKNIVERFAVLFSGNLDEVSYLLSNIFNKQVKSTVAISEYNEINRVLNDVRGNKTEAARRLGMSRTTLWRKLKQYEHI